EESTDPLITEHLQGRTDAQRDMFQPFAGQEIINRVSLSPALDTLFHLECSLQNLLFIRAELHIDGGNRKILQGAWELLAEPGDCLPWATEDQTIEPIVLLKVEQRI